MTMTLVSLVFEGAVSVLLIAVIVYAIKLNHRLVGLRAREEELGELIERFNESSGRAEASAAKLKEIGAAAEKNLGAMFERAQAVRDDLVFMVERGSDIADRVGRSIDKSRDRPSPIQASPAGRSGIGSELANAIAKEETQPDMSGFVDQGSADRDELPGFPRPRVAEWSPRAMSPSAVATPGSDPEFEEDDTHSEAERELLRALRTSGLRR